VLGSIAGESRGKLVNKKTANRKTTQGLFKRILIYRLYGYGNQKTRQTQSQVRMPHSIASDPIVFSDPFGLARRLRTAVWVYDTDHQRIAYANDAACEVWGAENEAALQARDLSIGMSKMVENRLRQYQSDFLERDARFVETWTLHPNGTPVTVDVVYTGFKLPDGRMAMMCETLGAAAETPETLRSAEALLHTDVVIALFTSNGDPLYQNPAARNVFTSGEIRLNEIFADQNDFAAFQRVWGADGESRGVTRICTSMGELWFELSVKQCLDAATGEPALSVTGFDVTELKNTRDKAHYLAARDQLTGCYNRFYIQSRMAEIKESTRATDYAVLFLDIDHFKAVNDSFGHEAGDTVLRAVADRLQTQVRADDIVARMGGDEFVVLLRRVPGECELTRRLTKMQTHLNQPVEFGELRLDVTTSIGSALVGRGSDADWSDVFKQADLALYHSKRSGRDQHTIYDDSIGANAIERNWLEAEIMRAIQSEAFCLHYQPRIDLKTHKVVCVEALLRWNHPERGYISPGTFIPVCEDMGVIDQVGIQVFEAACRQLTTWHRSGFDVRLAINVSPKQFQHEDFIALCAQTAANPEVPISKVELEITETSLVGDDEQVAERISRINELGFKIALDDFGTGYSNLAHISRFAVDCIKIDTSFTAQLPESGPLIRLIFALAKQINASIVAEGVETVEQLDWLNDRGCDQVQGFLFSKAVAPENLELVCENIETQSFATRKMKQRRAAKATRGHWV